MWTLLIVIVVILIAGAAGFFYISNLSRKENAPAVQTSEGSTVNAQATQGNSPQVTPVEPVSKTTSSGSTGTSTSQSHTSEEGTTRTKGEGGNDGGPDSVVQPLDSGIIVLLLWVRRDCT
jgi:uncharacterized protein (UPF0333 family)